MTNNQIKANQTTENISKTNSHISCQSKKIKVLFVCLGNICRSPAAHGVFQHIVSEEGKEDLFEIDSAGTYRGHSGELPDSRMRAHAARRGYNLTHRARPVNADDFETFDIILAMDDRNLHHLKQMAPTIEAENKIHRMVEFCHKYMHDCVPDPYYSGAEGFELVLDLLEDACRNLYEELVDGLKD